MLLMKTIGYFTCTDKMYRSLLYLSCYQVIIKVWDKSCSEICLSVSAKNPSSDEWNSLNLTYLHESCPQKNTDRPGDTRNIGEVACEFTVPMEYNFAESFWYNNGRRLNNLTWKSIDYPRLKDTVVIFGLRASPADHSDQIPRYCVSSSTLYDFKRTDYLGYQDFDQNQITYQDALSSLIKVSRLCQKSKASLSILFLQKR